MRFAKYIFVLIIVVTGAAPLNAQVGTEMRQIKNARGILLVSSAYGGYFKMQIYGRNVQRVHTPKNYWYSADGIRFQFFSEENSKFVMTDVPTLPDRTVLSLYRSDFLRRNSDEKLKLRSSWIRLANKKTALLWSYDKHPAAPTPIVEKEMFIVIATPAHVYGLFAQVPKGQTEAAVRRVLIRTLGSLTFSDEPFDLKDPTG
jgi:hypothetical protein